MFDNNLYKEKMSKTIDVFDQMLLSKEKRDLYFDLQLFE